MNRLRKRTVRCLAAALFVFFAVGETRAQTIYWTDIGTSKIRRLDLAHGGIEDLVTIGVSTPIAIALDVLRGKMYWTEAAPGQASISRANLDGSNVEQIVVGLDNPSGIAVDMLRRKVYWTDIGTRRIQRANLDGTQVEDLVMAAVMEPRRIALDIPAGRMYWTEGSPADFMIARADLDGSDVELLVTALDSPSGIAVNTRDDTLYWTDIGTHKIQRAELDGSGVQDLPVSSFAPLDIALDLRGGMFYWVEGSIADFVILRANLDGTENEGVVVLENGERPSGIAIDTRPRVHVRVR